jgi:acetoin utilization deacetylase AcuC-like enzyme
MNPQVPNNWTESLGYLLDDRYLLHDPGKRHPVSPKRLIAIQQMLEVFGAVDRWQSLQPRKARPDELELIHNPVHVENIETGSKIHSRPVEMVIRVTNYE